MARLDLQSVVVRLQHVFSQEIDDDVVILHINRGEYFASEIVGQHVWRLIEDPVRVSTICDHIQERFSGVDRATCEQDVLEFLEELDKAQLIDVSEE
jgi:hypothetical protein